VGDLGGVNHEKFRLLGDELIPAAASAAGPDFVLRIRRVEQERAAGNERFHHVVFLQERREMAGDEIGAADEIGRAIGSGPKRRCDTVMLPDFLES
jgi:hypothetical protein